MNKAVPPSQSSLDSPGPLSNEVMGKIRQPQGIELERGRARTVSTTVFHTKLALPDFDEASINAATEETINERSWDPGDVMMVAQYIPQPLIDVMTQWLAGYGVKSKDFTSELTMHAAEGSVYHHDGQSFPNQLFSVLWLGGPDVWDLHFPDSDLRIPLERGTAVFFDPANVHGVVAREHNRFDPETLGDGGVQVFAALNMHLKRPTLDKLFGIKRCTPDDPSVDFRPFFINHLTGAIELCGGAQ